MSTSILALIFVLVMLFFTIKERGPLYKNINLSTPNWKSIEEFPIPEDVEFALITDGKNIKLQNMDHADYSKRGRLTFNYRDVVTHWDYPPALPKEVKTE